MRKKENLPLVFKIATSVMLIVTALLMSFLESSFGHFAYSYTYLYGYRFENPYPSHFSYGIIETFENIGDAGLVAIVIIILCAAVISGIVFLWYKNIKIVSVAASVVLLLITLLSLISLITEGSYYVDNGYFIVLFFNIITVGLSVTTFILSGEHIGNDGTKGTTNAGNGYIDLTKHTVLCLFTFGVWYFIWIYRTTKLLNGVSNVEYYNPTNKLLLCIFVPFYSIYWFVKHCKRLDKYAEQNDIYSDLYSSSIVMSIFISIAECFLMQEKINSIARKLSSDSKISEDLPETDSMAESIE